MVLVGGESRRMGEDKASLDLAGKALVERVLDVVRPLFAELYIGAHEDSSLGDAYGLAYGNRQPAGAWPGAWCMRGPREGQRGERLFVLSCDLPMLRAEVVNISQR